MLIPVDISFNFSELDQIDKSIEIKSWYDRESLLYDTLNPQNIFTNRLYNSRTNQFIKSDPYIDRVLEQKTLFFDEYFREFEKFLRISNFNKLEYKKDKIVEVDNLSDSLREMFKHFKRYEFYNRHLTNTFNFDLKSLIRVSFNF